MGTNALGLAYFNLQVHLNRGRAIRAQIEYLRNLSPPLDLRYLSMGDGLTIALRDEGLDVNVTRHMRDCARPRTILPKRVLVCLPEGVGSPQ